MASEETRPLLINVNPKWKRSNLRSNYIPPPTEGTSHSHIQRVSPDNVVKIPSARKENIKSKWKNKLALGAILVSVVLERLVFYGFVGNFVLFLNLNPFKWRPYSAVCAMFLFYGVSYVMSLLGGWISDSFLGRFKTMVLSYIIYMCGYIMLPFLALNTDQTFKISTNVSSGLPSVCMASDVQTSSASTLFGESCSWLIVIILIIIAVAAGILKAIISPFGSDQLAGASQQKQLSFFNWFYWCVNIGSFLGLGVIAYVEQQERFFYGFVACTICLGICATIFVAGYPFYTSRPPDGSVLTNIFCIFKEAFRNRREQRKLRPNVRTLSRSRSSADDEVPGQVEMKIPFLDYAKQRFGGVYNNSLVDDVKKLGMILAVFAVLIPYWLVYFQMQTTFMFQGLNMKLSFAPINTTTNDEDPAKAPEIAVAWFSLCDALVVIILLPLFDRVIYPRMARAGYHFTFAKRIVLGMIFATLAMIAAGVVEEFRWQKLDPDLNASCFKTFIKQKIGTTTYYASDMSVLWQIPQYTLIGISEVFASVACLQFAVMVAPKSMKAAITGLYYFFCGIGSFLGSAIVAFLIDFNIWFPNKHSSSNISCWYPCSPQTPHTNDQQHKCHIDYYFFFLAGCEGLGLVLFIIMAKVYKMNIDELTFHAQVRKKTIEGGGTGNEGRRTEERNTRSSQ